MTASNWRATRSGRGYGQGGEGVEGWKIAKKHFKVGLLFLFVFLEIRVYGGNVIKSA